MLLKHNLKLKKINLYFGLILFVGFLATGYYMNEYFKPENLNNLVMRMQIRANHIYILFASLLNILSFKIELKTDFKVSKYLNTLFRILMIVAGITLVIAFFREHTGNLNTRSWTLFGVITFVVSVGLVLTNELIQLLSKKKNI